MFKKLLFITGILCGCLANAQECPLINSPAPNSADVPVDITLTWPAVSGIIGYSLTLGTFPGGEDVLTRRSAGLTNSFTPPTGLPENTRIYVTISMFLGDGRFLFCNEEMYFDTEDVTTPPPCTTLNSPINGEINVDNEGEIQWNYASTATGYLLSLGTTPGGTEILNEEDQGNVLSYRPQQFFPPETQIYVRITPYNENGTAGICNEESFTTGSGSINCGPFRDQVTGETVNFSPEIDFPDQIGVCLDDLPTAVIATDEADGYRWFRINSDNSQTLLSETAQVSLTDLGLYRYEAYNFVEQDGSTFECSESSIFTVIASQRAEIVEIVRDDREGGADLTVSVVGNGNYEFALDSPSGPYQDSPFFERVGMGLHTVYVRDQNGCGIAEKQISLGLPREAFPKFFTPNGDGINDYWQFAPSSEFSAIRIQSIHIYDRFGMLLSQIHPMSEGWDGKVNGRPLPASNYWFRAKDDFNNELTGYFALKR